MIDYINLNFALSLLVTVVVFLIFGIILYSVIKYLKVDCDVNTLEISRYDYLSNLSLIRIYTVTDDVDVKKLIRTELECRARIDMKLKQILPDIL